ncbi:1088_t:CDS:2, partial [Cetraspora pellucida]
ASVDKASVLTFMLFSEESSYIACSCVDVSSVFVVCSCEEVTSDELLLNILF